MPIDDLKDALKKLHANLESTNNVDAEMKTLLKVLESDIQNLLARKEETPADVNDLVTQAQSLSARFATQHPQLEQIVRELADSLARMGI
jgi:chromosome segregation ATPase